MTPSVMPGRTRRRLVYGEPESGPKRAGDILQAIVDRDADQAHAEKQNHHIDAAEDGQAGTERADHADSDGEERQA